MHLSMCHSLGDKASGREQTGVAGAWGGEGCDYSETAKRNLGGDETVDVITQICTLSFIELQAEKKAILLSIFF